MEDQVIKGNGKSKVIRAPADIPATFEEWREQLLAGQAYLDVVPNTATTGENIGVDKLGTPLNSETVAGKKEYDPTGEVAAAGGIPAYIDDTCLKGSDLSSSVESDSETTPASSAAVKRAYDLASAATEKTTVSLSTDSVSGYFSDISSVHANSFVSIYKKGNLIYCSADVCVKFSSYYFGDGYVFGSGNGVIIGVKISGLPITRTGYVVSFRNLRQGDGTSSFYITSAVCVDSGSSTGTDSSSIFVRVLIPKEIYDSVKNDDRYFSFSFNAICMIY